ARQHDGCGPVIDAGRIAGGYAAAIAFENGPQAFEVFGGSIMPMCSLVSKTAVALRADTNPTATAPARPVALDASPRDTAERRQVTVMFSDLVGSTALSARMD